MNRIILNLSIVILISFFLQGCVNRGIIYPLSITINNEKNKPNNAIGNFINSLHDCYYLGVYISKYERNCFNYLGRIFYTKFNSKKLLYNSITEGEFNNKFISNKKKKAYMNKYGLDFIKKSIYFFYKNPLKDTFFRKNPKGMILSTIKNKRDNPQKIETYYRKKKGQSKPFTYCFKIIDEISKIELIHPLEIKKLKNKKVLYKYRSRTGYSSINSGCFNSKEKLISFLEGYASLFGDIELIPYGYKEKN